MSHWVYLPLVSDLVSGEVLLDLRGTLWDLMNATDNIGSVDLSLRKYPGSGQPVVVRVSVDPRAFHLNGRSIDLPELLAALDAHV